MTEQITASFVQLFLNGDTAGASAMIDLHPEILKMQQGYAAHPLLRACVERNSGHCYKKSHMAIAELLIPSQVREFRTAVIANDVRSIKKLLVDDPNLIHADFTASRGISQAIHHWNDPAVGELLIEAGAKLCALTSTGESALAMQLRFGSIEGAKLLLDHGVDPNLGSAPHLPSESMVERIQLLLAHNWDIAHSHQLMLHDANHGHGERVKIWIEFGANPNATNDIGQTALHLFAARGTGRDAIRALVNAGSDIHATDHEGQTALDLATKATRQTATEELLRPSAKSKSP